MRPSKLFIGVESCRHYHADRRCRFQWRPGEGLVGASGRHPYVVNDSHFHLTNYVQEGANIHDS